LKRSSSSHAANSEWKAIAAKGSLVSGSATGKSHRLALESGAG
jgi:hypothetical protein